MFRVIVKKILNTPIYKIPFKIKRGIRNYILHYPVNIVLQTVSACNLKCTHCFINNFGKEIPDGIIKIMTFDEFKNIVDRNKNVVRNAEQFQFSTFEPILNKNLFKMMDYILEINPKIQFPFHTNTMALNEDIISKLENYPLFDFSISVDGMNKETIENFKTGSNFEQIIKVLTLSAKSKFKDKVGVVFVAHKNNIAEFPEYIDFINLFGIRKIFVNNLLSFTKETNDLILYSPVGNPEAERYFELASEKVRQNKQVMMLPVLQPELQGCTTCNLLFININGDVAPCDFLSVSTPFTMFDKTVQAQPIIFGNIYKEPALKIYRSRQFKNFRNRHLSGENITKSCLNCIDAYGLMCSHRKMIS